MVRLADCSLCLESINDQEEILHLCEDKSHGPCCKSCMEGYIKYQIDSQFSGSCSTILCPCLHEDKMKRQLIYSEWSAAIGDESTKKYEGFASSAVSFRCYGCDNLQSLLPDADVNAWWKVDEAIRNAFAVGVSTPKKPEEVLSDFERLLKDFERGVDTADVVYKQICTKYIPALWQMGDKECFDTFVAICKTIKNPERRANLLLRHLNRKPHVWSYCCDSDICYKCQTTGFHTGQTCEENSGGSSGQNYVDLIPCPQCGVTLTKGDGCDSMTCVCGHCFGWSTELDVKQKCNLFVEMYPSDTDKHCMSVLCDEMESEDKVVYSAATAWNQRHESTVSTLLLDWWKQRYPACPSQAAALLLRDVGEEDDKCQAGQCWREYHPIEVDMAAKSSLDMGISLVNTLYPNDLMKLQALKQHLFYDHPFSQQTLVYSHLTCGMNLSPMASCVTRWFDNQHSSLLGGKASICEKVAVDKIPQFLHLYGHMNINMSNSNSHVSPVTQWKRQNNIAFTGNSGVTGSHKWPGEYVLPVLYSPVFSQKVKKHSMRFCVQSTGTKSSALPYFAVGMCSRYAKSAKLSDFLRPEYALLGFANSSAQCHVHVHSTSVDVLESDMDIKVGDTVTLVYDASSGRSRLDLRIETTMGTVLHQSTVKIMANLSIDKFAVMFPSNIKLTLLPCGEVRGFDTFPMNNVQHRLMYDQFVSVLKTGSKQLLKHHPALVKQWSDEFVSVCDIPQDYYTCEIVPTLRRLLDDDNNHSSNSHCVSSSIQWKVLLWGECWNASKPVVVKSKSTKRKTKRKNNRAVIRTDVNSDDWCIDQLFDENDTEKDDDWCIGQLFDEGNMENDRTLMIEEPEWCIDQLFALLENESDDCTEPTKLTIDSDKCTTRRSQSNCSSRNVTPGKYNLTIGPSSNVVEDIQERVVEHEQPVSYVEKVNGIVEAVVNTLDMLLLGHFEHYYQDI